MVLKMLKEDYIMRTISNKIKFLAKILLGKENVDFEISEINSNDRSDELHNILVSLIKENRINEAENMLFNEFAPLDKRSISVAIDFYNRINKLDDEVLEKNNFSRKEIKEGLDDISKILGMDTYDL